MASKAHKKEQLLKIERRRENEFCHFATNLFTYIGLLNVLVLAMVYHCHIPGNSGKTLFLHVIQANHTMQEYNELKEKGENKQGREYSVTAEEKVLYRWAEKKCKGRNKVHLIT